MLDIPPDNGEAMMQMLERIKQLEKANQNISTEAMKAHQRVAELESQLADYKGAVEALGRKCTSLENDREYNAGLVKAAEKRMDAAEKLADAAQIFFVQQHGDLASANECAYSNCASLREKFKAYDVVDFVYFDSEPSARRWVEEACR